MKKSIFIFIITTAIIFSGCGNEKKQDIDGKTLLKQKCSTCHDLSMPAKTHENEIAPPMMAVTFHIKDFMKVNDPSQKKWKFIEFVADFAINPSKEKSFCDEESLKSYGLMPSQKGLVSEDELKAIATHMYDHYDQNKFLQLMLEKSKFDSLPKGEKLLRQNGCFNCHDKESKKVGPSFKTIAKKNANTPIKEIAQSIKKGSKGKYEGFRISMPPFPKISENDRIIMIKRMFETTKKKK